MFRKGINLNSAIHLSQRRWLFGTLNGEEIDLAQEVEGFIDDQTSIARMDIKKLWFMHLEHYKAWLKVKNTPSKYTIKGIAHSREANQIDSTVLDMPAPTETPTVDESTKANGPAGPDQSTARAAITVKAQAWQVRIFNNMMSSLGTWATDAGIPSNSIIALEYCHPKYDSQSPNSDAITSEWSQYPWLKITYDGSLVHPDHRWDQVQSFSYNKRAYILAGMTAARYEVVIAHEIGHVTKKQFERKH